MFTERIPPTANANDWDWLLFRQHDVVSRRQALAFHTARVLDRRCTGGRWQVVHRGIYCTHNGPLTREQTLWSACLAAGAGIPALLGGTSALETLGLSQFVPRFTDLILPWKDRRRLALDGLRIHRSRVLPEVDVRDRGDPPSTSAPRSVVDAVQWAATDQEARTILAMSLQQRIVGTGEIYSVLERLPQVRRRALLLGTLADVAGGSESLTELAFVELCRRAGLPTPTRQVRRRDSSGRVRYLDAYFDDWGIRVEIDGAHHISVEQWWRDMRRHNALAVRGEVLLRFPGFIVREHPDEAATALRDALLAAGWRPGRVSR